VQAATTTKFNFRNPAKIVVKTRSTSVDIFQWSSVGNNFYSTILIAMLSSSSSSSVYFGNTKQDNVRKYRTEQ